jgi:hypothetical protein
MSSQRRTLAAGTVADRSADAARVAELEAELLSLGQRLLVTRLVAQDMSRWVEDDTPTVDLIIGDVLVRWRACGNHGDPTSLNDFWWQYANRVEYASPENGNEWREEFCPPESEPFDDGAYYEAVWLAHVAELHAQATAEQATAA